MRTHRTRTLISVFLLAVFASSQVFFPLMVWAEETADTSASSTPIETPPEEAGLSDSNSQATGLPGADATTPPDATTTDSPASTSTTVVAEVSDVSTSSQAGFVDPFVVSTSSPATSTPLFFGITSDLPSDLSANTPSSTPPEIPDSGVYNGTDEATTSDNSPSVDQKLLSPDTEEMASSTATTTPNTPKQPTILSGTAVAMANVLNILNASFLNSLGSIIFSNYLKKADTIDLRDPSAFSGLCGDSLCKGDESVYWNLSQDGYVKNDIAISATSGQNEIISEDGGAITTGDAYAGLNLINLVNSVFSHSEYLLAAINAFNGVTGDIVFPGLDKFLGQSSSGSSSFESLATITTNASSSADSGNNEIGENSALKTGAAQAYTNVYNQVNSFLPGNGVTILMRLSGTWTGQIFGAPSGLEIIHGADGSMYLFGTLGGPSTASDEKIMGTSTAEIENNISTAALSGQNRIEGDASLITTGNAYAGANIVNIANQHVIGKNWLLAIINIFGDFNGNIAFGRPDLWVGDKVSGPAFIENGSKLSYTMTVINNGDADAHHVILAETPDTIHGDIASSSIPFATTTTGVLSFDLGTIPKGKAVEITYEMTVKNTSPGTPITNKTEVTLEETDNNIADNSDTTTITTSIRQSGGGGSYYIPPTAGQSSQTANNFNSGGSQFPIITALRQTASTTISRETATTSQNLSIRNETNTKATGVIVHDILKNPSGDIIHDEYFDLGDIAGKEEVIIGYDLSFGPQAPAGLYTLETKIEGHNIASRTIVNGAILLLSVPTDLSAFTSSASTSPIVTEEIRSHARVAPTTSAGLSTTTLISLVKPSNESIPRQNLLANAYSGKKIPASVTMLALTIIIGTLAYVGRTYLPKNPFKA